MFSVVSDTFSFIRHIHTNTQHNTYNNTNTHRQTHTQTCFVSVQIVHQFLIWKRVKKRVFKLLFVSFSQWKRTWTEMWKYWNQPSVASVVKTLFVNSSQKKEYVHCLADVIIQNNVSDFRNLSDWQTSSSNEGHFLLHISLGEYKNSNKTAYRVLKRRLSIQTVPNLKVIVHAILDLKRPKIERSKSRRVEYTKLCLTLTTAGAESDLNPAANCP